MQVTANPANRTQVVVSLVRPTGQKRRSLKLNAHPRTDRNSKKAVPPVSPSANGKLRELEAIQRARHGDPTAFECLYHLHSRRVYSICLRMVRNPTEAEDLTQESFLLLLRKIHTFRGESAFSSWLHRLTVNLVLMRLRKRPPPTVTIEAAPDLDDENGAAGLDFGAHDLLLEGSIDRINLQRCIERLAVGYREVFILHDVQGHEHHEIARILGLSVGASKSQLHKARSRLRELLHEIQREKTRDERMKAAKAGSSFSEGSSAHGDLAVR
jgi:RNA polymerase sigma-70 factor, ECF subfamily